MSFWDMDGSWSLQETKTASVLDWLRVRLVPYLFI